MALPHWLVQLPQEIEAVSPVSGWIISGAMAAATLIRRLWVFQDKRVLAQRASDAVVQAQLKEREAAFYKQRAEVAEETVAALNTAIDQFKKAVQAELDALRDDIKDLQHRQSLYASYVRDVLAFTAGKLATMPELPQELRDDVRP